MAVSRTLKIMFVAGEPSGDLRGAELAAALKELIRKRQIPCFLKFTAAGGERLRNQGAAILADMTGDSVVGLAEALGRYRYYKRIFNQLLERAVRDQPDAIVLIDFSGFNRRFAAAVRQYLRAHCGAFCNWRPKIIYYVSPQVWASRPGRAKTLERDLDLLLSIFPFEKEWYARRAPGLKVEFVGHPVIDQHGIIERDPEDQEAWELLLLPGSRAGELARHLPVIVPAAKRLAEELHCPVRMVLPSKDSMTGQQREQWLQAAPMEIQYGDLPSALRRARLAIASTGTVTLECACFKVPTIALYKTSWSTYQIARRIIQVSYLAMPNILADKLVYPELIQQDASVETLFHTGRELWKDLNKRKIMVSELDKVIESLGPPGACYRAARHLLDAL